MFGQLATWSAAREQVQHAVAGSIANEVLNAVRTVAAFNGEPHAISRYCYYKSGSGNKERVGEDDLLVCQVGLSERRPGFDSGFSSAPNRRFSPANLILGIFSLQAPRPVDDRWVY